MIRLGLVRHRVGDTLDPDALRRLAQSGATINRAAHLCGVHWSTVERVARAHRIAFPVHYRGYGWPGVERSG